MVIIVLLKVNKENISIIFFRLRGTCGTLFKHMNRKNHSPSRARSRKRDFKSKEEKKVVSGTIRIHHRGFGFLKPEEGSEEVFIPKQQTYGAVDGDFVEVEINLLSFSEKGPEGRVHQILKRGHSHVAGTITAIVKEGGGLCLRASAWQHSADAHHAYSRKRAPSGR